MPDIVTLRDSLQLGTQVRLSRKQDKFAIPLCLCQSASGYIRGGGETSQATVVQASGPAGARNLQINHGLSQGRRTLFFPLLSFEAFPRGPLFLLRNLETLGQGEKFFSFSSLLRFCDNCSQNKFPPSRTQGVPVLNVVKRVRGLKVRVLKKRNNNVSRTFKSCFLKK